MCKVCVGNVQRLAVPKAGSCNEQKRPLSGGNGSKTCISAGMEEGRADERRKKGGLGDKKAKGRRGRGR